MRALLLGTGAADGWPQPFCRCASCEHARASGTVRARGGVLVDDVVLMDPSPDSAVAAARAGVTLDRVGAVLVGHAHHDHLDPSLLLARHWAGVTAPLEVHGPRSALDAVRPWLDPAALDTGSVVLREAVVGVPVALPSGHTARALPAAHGLGSDGWPSPGAGPGDEAVLWEVTSPEGSRMLLMADTASPSEEVVASLAPLDLLLVEETFGHRTDHGTAHLDLRTLPRALAALRAAGVVTDSTEVVAVHLSHHNPPEPELVAALSPWGARPGHDLETVQVGAGTPRGPLPSPRRTLVTGGARSGKSRAAEQLLLAHPRVAYLATAAGVGTGPEWEERVAAHRARRPGHWSTLEGADPVATIEGLGDDDALLVDCLTLWLTGVLDRAGAWERPECGPPAAREELGRLCAALRHARGRVVLVTNEVGSGIVPEGAGTRMFRDLLGEANARVAQECDDVLLAVAGRVVALRGSA